MALARRAASVALPFPRSLTLYRNLSVATTALDARTLNPSPPTCGLGGRRGIRGVGWGETRERGGRSGDGRGK